LKKNSVTLSLFVFEVVLGRGRDRFAHRPNGPWPRAPRFWGPRATLTYGDPLAT